MKKLLAAVVGFVVLVRVIAAQVAKTPRSRQ